MGHTPGQWELIRRSDTSANIEVWGGDLRSVLAEIREGSLCDEHGGDYLDNARLMAAAPDLLEQLILAQRMLLQTDWYHDDEAMNDIAAAIQKAKGAL